MTTRIFLYPYAGPQGRNYIRQLGTQRAISQAGLDLREGARLSFWTDDANDQGEPDELFFEGTVHFDSDEESWYVIVDDQTYHHRSDESDRDTRLLPE